MTGWSLLLCLLLSKTTNGWISRIPVAQVRLRGARRLARSSYSDYVRSDDEFYDSAKEFRSGRGGSNPYWEEGESNDNFRESNSWQENDAEAGTMVERDLLEWEYFDTPDGTVHILLPPPIVEIPTAVIHFVGGTFFGSAPSTWYRQLLEDLVRHTQVAVVATSVPVTIFQSPLEHISLSKQTQRQFQLAWRDVIRDEYRDDGIFDVPVCAMGHSLGARLLVLLETLQRNPPSDSVSPPKYKAMVVISFINHAAGSGIPGVNELSKSSRRMERQASLRESATERERRESSRRASDWSRDIYDTDDDDEGWDEIWQDVRDGLQQQTRKVRQALTPASQDLEFYPSPEQLWDALLSEKRYKIPKTLMVQFDEDILDQSVKLVETIKNCTDVKFARLRGTHLTPVSTKGIPAQNGGVFVNFNSNAFDVIGKLVTGKRRNESNEANLRDLRQSISRYIIEVVTKE